MDGAYRWPQWASLACRLVLAAVWLWASISKLPNLDASVLAVRGYQVLPFSVAMVVGYALPLLELILGLLLLTGLFTRAAGVVSSLLLLAFIAGIAQAWARGLSIDCGCFGGGGQIAQAEAVAKYPWEIARDVGLILLGAWLVWRPRSPFSLDRMFFEPSAAYAELGDDTVEPPDETQHHQSAQHQNALRRDDDTPENLEEDPPR